MVWSGTDVPGHPGDPPGDPESVARAICLRLLNVKPRTRAQLAEGMQRRGIPQEVATGVLDRFTEVGLIDDRTFARAWVDSRHHGRGLSRRALAAELHQRGVDSATVSSAVDGLDPHTELATARALVRRRLPSTRGLAPTIRARRLAGVLARKGYPAGLTFRVVREVLEGEGEGWDEDWAPEETDPSDDEQHGR